MIYNGNYGEIENMGFGDRISYWQKRVEYGRYIRIFTDTHEIRFFEENLYNSECQEITDYVPIWAFKTIVKMINMGMIEE